MKLFKKKDIHEYRVRVVTLNDGTQKFYPEVKVGFGWNQIVTINNQIEVSISSDKNLYHVNDEDIAREYISRYEQKQKELLAKEIKSEEMIVYPDTNFGYLKAAI